MYTDFMDKLAPSHFKPHIEKMPLKLLEKNPKPYFQYIVLPHETFATLYHHYQHHWQERVVNNFGVFGTR